MNTKTMRLPPRRVSMPTTNKRKERDGFDLKRLAPPLTKLPKPTLSLPGSDKATKPVHSNQLLAGYLAHEFLTRGTLFGETWDPTGPRQTGAESKRGIGEFLDLNERSRDEEAEPKAKAKPEPREEKRQRYVEVASLLKTDGVHIPGIVNPSQLARFLQM